MWKHRKLQSHGSKNGSENSGAFLASESSSSRMLDDEVAIKKKEDSKNGRASHSETTDFIAQ